MIESAVAVCSVRNIDWEQFITNTLANSFVLHMRMFKKSKDKLNGMKATLSTQTTGSVPLTMSQQQLNDENFIVETFFDLEADFERGVCRDEISNGANGKEQGILEFFWI